MEEEGTLQRRKVNPPLGLALITRNDEEGEPSERPLHHPDTYLLCINSYPKLTVGEEKQQKRGGIKRIYHYSNGDCEGACMTGC